MPDLVISSFSRLTDVQSSDGTRISVRISGPDDGQPIVLCHGLGLTRASWGRVPGLLAAEHRVITYDLRGHGESSPGQDGDYGLFSHANDLSAVLAGTLRESERAVVVGHSLGGGIILAHAHVHADERFAGAVFAGSGGSAITLPGLPPPAALDWAARPLRGAWVVVLRATANAMRLLRPVHPFADALIRRLAFEPDPPQDAVRQVREHFAVSRPEVLGETTLASGAHDGAAWAPQLDVPAIVLHGEHDPQVSTDNARRLAHGLPQGRLVELAGAGHMLPLTHPEAVAEHVKACARAVA